MGLLDIRLSGSDSRNRVLLRPAAACGGMPWNGKEKKIAGTGCSHHEMMVATEKRVISPMSLDSVRTLRFPKIRKIYTRLQEKQKQQETRTPENPSLPIPLIVHNFNADGTTISQSPWRSSGLSA